MFSKTAAIRLAGCLLIIGLQFCCDFLFAQTEKVPVDPTAQSATTHSAATTEQLRTAVATAFEKTHDGWSADEVILNTMLNDPFVTECKTQLPSVKAVEFNWTLLNMRKAGLLKTKATKRNSDSTAALAPIAEVAARSIFDRHKVSTDRMMADPELRSEFDATITAIDPTADLYLARKSAFQLRKQRRLKPELIARIADWGRTIQSFPLSDVAADSQLIPELPGIYIFRDQTGYLYIGQSDDLRQRLKEHLDESSNFSLKKYLSDQGNDNISIEIHAFPADSRAKETMIRRAYESELIASRQPRFNIQP